MADPAPLRHCRNCAAELAGPFCAQCGQEADGHRRSLGSLGRSFIDHFIDLDSRVLRTLATLIFRPGALTRDFIDGRRQRYVPALRLYLFTTLMFFLVLGISGIAIAQLEFRGTQDGGLVLQLGDATVQSNVGINIHFFEPLGIVQPTSDLFLRDQLLDLLARERERPSLEEGFWEDFSRRMIDGINRSIIDPAAINQPLTAWIPRLLFVMLPVFALLLALLYWRQRFFLVDHLVSALHIHTLLFLLILAAIPVSSLLPAASVFFGVLIVFLLHTFLALRNAYGQGWRITILKFIALTIPYALLLLAGVVLVFAFAIADA